MTLDARGRPNASAAFDVLVEARARDVPLMTADAQVLRYDVPTIAVGASAT